MTNWLINLHIDWIFTTRSRISTSLCASTIAVRSVNAWNPLPKKEASTYRLDVFNRLLDAVWPLWTLASSLDSCATRVSQVFSLFFVFFHSYFGRLRLACPHTSMCKSHYALSNLAHCSLYPSENQYESGGIYDIGLATILTITRTFSFPLMWVSAWGLTLTFRNKCWNHFS